MRCALSLPFGLFHDIIALPLMYTRSRAPIPKVYNAARSHSLGSIRYRQYHQSMWNWQTSEAFIYTTIRILLSSKYSWDNKNVYFNLQYCVNYRFDLKLSVFRTNMAWNNRQKSLDSLVDFKLYICLLPHRLLLLLLLSLLNAMDVVLIVWAPALPFFCIPICWCSVVTHFVTRTPPVGNV